MTMRKWRFHPSFYREPIGKDGLDRDETAVSYWWEVVDGNRILVKEGWTYYYEIDPCEFLKETKKEIKSLYCRFAQKSTHVDSWQRLLIKYEIYEKIALTVDCENSKVKKQLFKSSYGKYLEMTRMRALIINQRNMAHRRNQQWVEVK